MTEAIPSEPPPEPVRAKPYGVFGLLVSLVLILMATAALCLLVAALCLAIETLVLGWPRTADALFAQIVAMQGDRAELQRSGIVVSLVVYVALVTAILAAARVRASTRWRDLVAWHRWQAFRGTGWFWGLAVVTFLYSFGAQAIISRLYPPSDEWVSLPHGPFWATLFIALAVLFAPPAEELLFRGWLYTALRPVIGIWAGILICSVLFALAHWEKTHLYALAVLPVGVVLGFIREKTGSVKASMTFHAIYNAAASALLLAGH